MPAQTDASPCTAAGGNICGRTDCVVANNSLPLGAKVKIEKLGTCTVMDRLAPRYNDQPHRFDWYAGGADKIALARSWGVRHLAYEVLD